REDGPVDIVVLAAGKKIVPKLVWTATGWQPASVIQSSSAGDMHRYLWRLTDYAGQPVRIVLLDEDNRPGCYLTCTGFQLLYTAEHEKEEFRQAMVDLAGRHDLTAMVLYEGEHFIAMSNANLDFSQARLNDCELMYGMFYQHFGAKGFLPQPPSGKLMVAIFDSQTGFEAYLDQKVATGVTGIYHPSTNRFVVYDYGQNRDYVSQKEKAQQHAKALQSSVERQRYLGAVQR